MSTKIAEMHNSVAIEMGTIIDFVDKNNIVENTDIKALTYGKTKNKFYTYSEKIIRRLLDLCVGIIGALVLVPLTLIIFVVNKLLKDEGSIFYYQDRIGKDGKIFKMLKYRSMVEGADEKLKKYLEENEEAKEEYKKYKKLKNDPRVTIIGKILRQTSLDEMPQVLHLITGEMTLVGPRPYLIREKEDMGEYYNIIIKNKPGLTGLWQVSGRSNATFNDRLDLDVIYDKNKSLKEDFKILYKTAIHVIKGEGAI